MNGFITRLLDRQLNPGNVIAPQTRGRYEPEPLFSEVQPGQHDFSAGLSGERNKPDPLTHEEHLIENINTIDNPSRPIELENSPQKQSKRTGIKFVQPSMADQLQDQVAQNGTDTGDIEKKTVSNFSSKSLEKPDTSAKGIMYEGTVPNTNINKEPEIPRPGRTGSLLKTSDNIHKEITGPGYHVGAKKTSSANRNEKTEKTEDDLNDQGQVQRRVTGKKPVITSSSGKENPAKEDHPLKRPVVASMVSTRQVPEKDRPLRNKMNQPAPKLVIGKIIVEIIPPAAPVPPKVITRTVQSSSKENQARSNKLIFGLGQL